MRIKLLCVLFCLTSKSIARGLRQKENINIEQVFDQKKARLIKVVHL